MKKNHNAKGRAYYRAIFHRNKLNFALTILMALIGGTSNAIASWFLGEITDAMTNPDRPRLVQLGWMLVLVLTLVAVVIWCSSRVNARFIKKGMSQYKQWAFRALTGKSLCAFSQENTGTYLSALTNDANTIETQYMSSISQIVELCFSFLLALGMMLWYSPMLTLILIAFSALPMLIALLMSGKYAALEKQVSDENERYTAQIKDLLTGFDVMKSFQAEKECQKLFDRVNTRTEDVKKRKRDFNALMQAASNSAGFMAQMGTFLAGAFMAIDGQITPGTVLIFVNLCNSIIYPIQTVPTCLAYIKGAGELIAKLEQITLENTQRTGEKIEPQLTEGIEMKDLSFSYDGEKTVLHDINLQIRPGGKYAIVGASGSGKSTLLRVMMGAYEQYTGSVTVNHKEVREIDPDSLFGMMGMIGQNVFLFDSTIRENITMFRQFPDEAVEKALHDSGLDRVIADKGEDYRCGENGTGLSGGERQRVSIARSLLRKTSVLMLDEATAALDNQTAFDVTDAILRLEDTTRIVVTHRLEEALLRQYDNIIVLRDGRITEQGAFDDLMARKQYFYSLYNVAN